MISVTRCIITSFLILLFSFTIGYQQEGWYQQTPPAQTPVLMGIYALDAQDIWAVGDSGRIIHSTDGGVNWLHVASSTAEMLLTVEFISQDTGWVAGDDDFTATTLLMTTNRGLTWGRQTLPGSAALPMYDIDFLERSPGQTMLGYLTGALGYTYRTEDYGATWIAIRNNCENTFWSMCFVNQDTGIFVGEPSTAHPYTIMCTTDGGSSWIQQTNPTGRNLRGVCFATDQRGLAVGLVGTILYTSDGGTTWESRPNAGYRWESVYMTGTGKAWAVGSSGNIAYSTDWGYTWTPQQSGVSVELWEVYFVNDNEGWIVGGGMGQPGVILHTTTAGVVTDIPQGKDPIITEFRLRQNYPNPFNPTTIINYQIPSISHVLLKIYDLSGRELATLVNERKSTGNHSIVFNRSGLASGIYFYRLEADEFVETRKMIIMK